jgi:hypothetical protein
MMVVSMPLKPKTANAYRFFIVDYYYTKQIVVIGMVILESRSAMVLRKFSMSESFRPESY